MRNNGEEAEIGIDTSRLPHSQINGTRRSEDAEIFSPRRSNNRRIVQIYRIDFEKLQDFEIIPTISI